MKQSNVGKVTLAAGVSGTITVPVNTRGVPIRISLTSSTGDNVKSRIKSLVVGGTPLIINTQGVYVPWRSFVNREADTWDLTDDFGENLEGLPVASGTTGVVAEVENGEAAGADLTLNVVTL